jgi:predicted ATPase/DNA-binding SARP family transcriptional activator/uncharacterized protein HemY
MNNENIWYIRLLGGLRAERGGEVVSRFRSQKIGALLAYLSLFPQRAHAREELADLLWPDADPESGRANLRVALASLRRQLEPPGTPAGSVLVAEGRQNIGLQAGAVDTDVRRFEQALKAAARPGATPDEQLRFFSEAADAYAGPLLPGYYETWALSERDRLAEAHGRVLRELVHRHEQAGNLSDALDFARRAVTADPLSEDAHAAVIRLLIALGQPGVAKRQFDELTRLLNEQLGADPSPEVRALLSARPAAPPARHQPRPKIAGPVEAATPAPAPANNGPVPAAVPQPRTADETLGPAAATTAYRLPPTFTRFFGRENEIVALCDTLRSPDTCLVTVTGPGGSGKTRLAVETARRLGEHFAGGVYFVPLADLREPDHIPGAIADALGLPRAAQQNVAPLEQVIGALARPDRAPVLLVLDNFEHLIDGAQASGAAIVRSLQVGAPCVCCLVTSRQKLLLDGEQEFALAPLPTPDEESRRLAETPERLLEFPSVALFVSRAQAARPDFALTARNAGAVAELCLRLEGIPLAIELAAAWAQTLTPAQMLDRLERRFDLLVSRRRDAPGRHATLRATIEWSWELLSPELRRFFARLSIFRGGWTLLAAEAVTGEPDALSSLAELRERSLIVAADGQDEHEDESGEMRFRMLETLRDFARQQFDEAASAADRADLAGRHLAYFLDLAQQAEGHLRGPRQKAWLRRLQTEHDNLRAALTGSAAGSPDDAATAEARLHLAGALLWFWLARGHVAEGRERLARALSAAPGASAAARAKALRGAGWLAWRVHDRESAMSLTEQALVLSQKTGDVWGTAFCHNTLGEAAYHNDDFVRASEHLETGVALARQTGDAWLLGHCLLSLGHVLLRQQHEERARASFEEALAAFRVQADGYGVAEALRALGHTYCSLKRPDDARRSITESRALFRELGDTGAAGLCSLVLGFLASDENDFARAREHFDDALRLCREVGDRFGAAHALHNRAYVCLSVPDYAAAQADFAQSLALFRALGYQGDVAMSLEGFVTLAAAQGDWERAMRLLGACSTLRQSIGIPLADIHEVRQEEQKARARAVLGATRAQAAWEQGCATSIEQAIADVQGGEPATNGPRACSGAVQHEA